MSFPNDYWRARPGTWQPPRDKVTRATYDYVVRENNRLRAELDQAKAEVARLEVLLGGDV